MQDVATLALAVVLAAVGGELFLKGVLGTAAGLRVPKLLVATTLAAFATSSPELTVSTVAALAGEPELGLGDALGSNVVNIALIFGVALLFGPIHASRDDLGRDFALALGVPFATLAMAADGVITRIEGLLLLLVFGSWLVVMVHAGLASRRRNNAGPPLHDGALFKTAVLGLAGLVGLIAAGRLFVVGASGVAAALGMTTYVIGALVVAIGTSLPELVTVILSRLRGHDDIGVGTLIGSNLFNGLAIVGVASSIHPIRPPFAAVAISLAFGWAALILLVPGRDQRISRSRGIVLLALYLLFVSVTLGAGIDGLL